MKALIRNNFYLSEKSFMLTCGVSVLLVVCYVAGSIWQASSFWLLGVIWLHGILFVSLVPDMLSKLAATRWDAFELALPVGRNDVVKSRYASFLLYGAVGLAFSLLALGVSYLVWVPFSLERAGYGFTMQVYLMFLVPAVMYPVALKVGFDKVNTVFYIAVFGGVGVFVLASLVCMDLVVASSVDASTASFISNVAFRLAVVAISALAFVVSYKVSCAMYRKRDL